MQYLRTCIEYQLLGSATPVLKEFVGTYQDQLIQIEVVHKNNESQVFIHTQQAIEIKHLSHHYSYVFDSKDQIMCNGFQSWTETRLFSIDEKMKRYHPLVAKFSKPFGDALYYDYPVKKGYLHAWSYAYIKRPDASIQLIASFSDHDAFTLIEFQTINNRIILSKDISGCIIENEATLFKMCYLDGEENQVFESYFTATGFSKKEKKMNGWTSWYNYYTQIDEAIIQKQIDNFTTSKEYPIDIFQIDDGWQKSIGDWLHCNPKFPNGLKPFVRALHQSNIQAGLWLAPFVCEKKSFIYKEHSEWILHDKNQQKVKAGYNPMWNGDFYVLDFYNDACRDYLEKVLRTVLFEWDFDMVKLDFLYAVCLQSRPGKTRAAIMYEAMQWLRSVCGDKLILACGVPLMPCAGQVDFCRIGPDISLGWNEWLVDLFRLREGISTRKSIGNTLARKHLDSYWFANDPDVFILRNENQKMTWPQRQKLFEANKSYGSLLFTSDDISNYTDAMKKLYGSIFRK